MLNNRISIPNEHDAQSAYTVVFYRENEHSRRVQRGWITELTKINLVARFFVQLFHFLL